ncbi:MAG: nitroreductase [Cryomorphaceae bacterium]|jgi:nitroreductase
MNEFIALLKNHRSIRQFTDQQVPENVFSELVTAAQAASTSSYIQAVSIVQINNLQVREQFVELAGGQSYIAGAAEFLVFCADLSRNSERVEISAGRPADFAWTEQFLAATIDVALLAQNFVIAAESIGLGCCYIGGIRNDPTKVTELLELPTLVYPVFGLCLGYPNQNPEIKPRLPRAAIVHQDKYVPAALMREVLDGYDTHVRDYYLQRTSGKLDLTWSDQMAKQAQSQSREFMMNYLNNQGFMKK